MNKINILAIRIVFGIVFAVILSRFFHPETNITYIIGLGVFLVGMAYVLDYLRSKKST